MSSQSHIAVEGCVGLYASEWEFSAPTVVLEPDQSMQPTDMLRLKLVDEKWVPPVVCIPIAKFTALVSGHARCEHAGSGLSALCMKL